VEKMNQPPMRPPKCDKQVGRPSKKRRKNLLEEEEGTRMSRHGIISHCSLCNGIDHNKRKCSRLGRGPEPAPQPEAPGPEPTAQPEARPKPTAQTKAPGSESAATPLALEPEPATAPLAPEPEPYGDELEKPKKLVVKRNSNYKVH
jgi:hypothetical protein